jgi:hypothetical protein
VNGEECSVGAFQYYVIAVLSLRYPEGEIHSARFPFSRQVRKNWKGRVVGKLASGFKKITTQTNRTIGVKMISYAIFAATRGGYIVWLKFNDGLSVEIDQYNELDGPIFEPLKYDAS